VKLATLCYVRAEGKTLMLLRNKKENDIHEGKWNGLGGKMNAGETPEECVTREVFEESGLDIREPRLRGIITFPAFDGEDDWYVFLFTAGKFEGELIDSPEGELAWIDNDKLEDLNLWEGDKVFLQWLDDERVFSAKFVYDNYQFKGYEVTFY